MYATSPPITTAYWDNSGGTLGVTAPSITPTITGAGSLLNLSGSQVSYVILFADATTSGSGSVAGEWSEIPVPTSSMGTPAFANDSTVPLTLSNVGFQLSPTLIPLDNLNFNSEPPSGMTPFSGIPNGTTVARARRGSASAGAVRAGPVGRRCGPADRMSPAAADAVCCLEAGGQAGASASVKEGLAASCAETGKVIVPLTVRVQASIAADWLGRTAAAAWLAVGIAPFEPGRLGAAAAFRGSLASGTPAGSPRCDPLASARFVSQSLPCHGQNRKSTKQRRMG